jgi:mannose-6-phosphate isomerase class I
MINSDNVIRGGLTPKYKDNTTLLQLLNFEKIQHFVPKVGKELLQNKGEQESILEYYDEAYPELRVFRVFIPEFIKKWV